MIKTFRHSDIFPTKRIVGRIKTFRQSDNLYRLSDVGKICRKVCLSGGVIC